MESTCEQWFKVALASSRLTAWSSWQRPVLGSWYRTLQSTALTKGSAAAIQTTVRIAKVQVARNNCNVDRSTPIVSWPRTPPPLKAGEIGALLESCHRKVAGQVGYAHVAVPRGAANDIRS